MNKTNFRKLLRECIEEVLIESSVQQKNTINSQSDDDPLYVEYVKPMTGESPFMLHEEKFEYCWAKYPNGKIDIGVYAYRGDVCYSYNAFKQRYNLKENKRVSEAKPKTEMLSTMNAVNLENNTSDDTIPGKFMNRGEINLQGGVDEKTAKKMAHTVWAVFGSELDNKKVWHFKTRGNAYCCAVGIYNGEPVLLSKITTLDRVNILTLNDLKQFYSYNDVVSEMTSTGAVAGIQTKNWVDPDPERERIKSIATNSVGGKLA